MFIDVTDKNIQSDENGNPVITLRVRYDAWKAQNGVALDLREWHCPEKVRWTDRYMPFRD
tara:strand:+ start:392 stop:571 length:180 start_codon:yes stop_codon:yes gene_type:complete